MRDAAAAFVGLRDFNAFAAAQTADDEADGGERSTLVRIERLEIVEEGDLVLVGIEGSHFLWKMVRRIVGVLVEIGRGRLEPDAAARLLTTASDLPARLTAPPSGLFLHAVRYGPERGRTPVALRAITPLRMVGIQAGGSGSR
jgi:tRNA pseudouridine38-40 synthase